MRDSRRWREAKRSPTPSGRSPRPLPRGVTLSWQVTATTARGAVQAPVPPAPEARFRVADARTVASLDDARRVARGSHLLLAIAYRRAGIVDAMNAELEALRARTRIRRPWPRSPQACGLSARDPYLGRGP